MIKLELPAFKKIETIARNTPGCISFSQGVLRAGGVPAPIRDYAREILTTDVADYYQHTLGIMPLREKIAKKFSTSNTMIDPEQVIITHGAINAINALAFTLLETGDEVILPTPTYPVYKNVVLSAKANPVFVTAFTEKKTSQGSIWVFDVEQIIKAITPKTRMIIIPNPSNPTGTCLSRNDILALKNVCDKYNIYFVSDEVYEYYVFDGEFSSSIDYINTSNNIFRVGSFSKNFAMSGWRVGFIIAPRERVDGISAIQSAIICCPTVISQHAALYALDHESLMKPQIEKVKQARAIAYKVLAPLVQSGDLKIANNHAGFYLFAQTKQADCYDLVMDILKNAQVALAPGKDFGPEHKSYFRLCYARELEIVQEGCTRLVSYFEKK